MRRASWSKLEARGFEMLVAPEHRLPMLNSVIPRSPTRRCWRRRLLETHGIEVGGGLGNSRAGSAHRLMARRAAEVVARLAPRVDAILSVSLKFGSKETLDGTVRLGRRLSGSVLQEVLRTVRVREFGPTGG